MGRRSAVMRRQEVPALTSEGDLNPSYWILVQTHGGREVDAAACLRHEGFEVYLPLRLVRRKDGSTSKTPYYPRYLFVRVTLEVERWQVLFTTRGVIRVMGSHGRPIGLRDEFVNGIKREEVDGYLRLGLVPGRAKCDFKKGEEVTVDGMWKGLFDHVDGRRVTVLLSTLSSDSRVTVDLARVARWAGEVAKG